MSKDQDPQAEKAEDQSPKLPERDFFSGDRMFKFAEELGVFQEESSPAKDQPKPTAKAKASKDAEVPCPNCPPEKKTPKPDTTVEKPFRVLKVDGKEFPVRDEKHMEELASKGVDYTQKRQRDAEWERSLTERETKLEEMRPILEKVAKGLELKNSEKRALAEAEAAGSVLPSPATPQQAEEDDDEPLDPVATAKIKRLENELAEIKKFRQGIEQNDLKRKENELRDFVQAKFQEVRTEHPFEEAVDEETGENITEQAFAGIMAIKVNNDRVRAAQDPSYKLRTIPEYMKETAKHLSRLQLKSNGSSGLDRTTLQKSHPDLYEEIRQEAVAEFLRKQGETPPAPRARMKEARSPLPSNGGQITGIDDAIDKAMSDPGVEAEIDKFGRQFRG